MKNIILLNKIESQKDSSTKSKSRSTPIIRLDEYSEEDYLAGKYFKHTKPTEQAKKLYYKLKNQILDTFPKSEYKQKKKYAGFYSKKDGSAMCTIEATTNSLKLCYSTTKTNILPETLFIRHMVASNGKKIGHWGVGDFLSTIKNEKDVEKAIPLIQKIYEFKIK